MPTPIVPFRRHPVPFALLLAMLIALLVPGGVRAEGSYQTGLNQSLFEYGGTDPGFAPLDRPVYVDLFADGEIVNISLCGVSDTDDLRIQIFETSPDVDGEPVTGSEVFDVTTSGATVPCSDPFTGPLGGAVTFDSGVRSYAFGSHDTYEIRLTNLNAELFERFDVTVTPDTASQPDPTGATGITGRVWALSWAFSGGSFSQAAATDADFYTLAPSGATGTDFVWKLDLNDFAGFGYDIVANGIGVDPPNSGKSTPVDGNSVTPQYPVFLDFPERAALGTEPDPVLTGVGFLDDESVDASISPGFTPGVQDTGAFLFDANVEGTYAITIDVNQDGAYGAGDVLLAGYAQAGSNAVTWDGLDAAGDPYPLGSYTAQIQLRIGEFHFVASDVETSGGGVDNGLTIERAFSGGTTSQVPVYWDDATLLGGTTSLPDGIVGGRHTWGNFSSSGFGDKKYIDTYVYADVAVEIDSVVIDNDETARPPDVAIDKTASVATARPGDTFQYVLTVENLSTEYAANGVAIEDALPAGITLLASSGCIEDPVGVPTCSLGDLEPGVSTAVTLEVQVDPGTSGDIVNSASATLVEQDADPSDNSDSATVTVIPGVSVAGTVYHDLAPNGRPDGADGATGLTSWVKRVNEPDGDCASLDGGPAVEAAAVAADGSYAFAAVPDGSWCLLLDDNDTLTDVTPFDANAAGWWFISPPDGVRTTLVAGVAVSGQDFGLFEGSRVSGTVFLDDGRLAAAAAGASDPSAANNGVIDAAEPGVPGVRVEAGDGTSTRSVVTDGAGGYELYLPAAWSAPVTLSHPLRPATGYHDRTAPQLAATWDGSDVATVSYAATDGGDAGYDFGVVAASRLRPDRQGQATSPGGARYTHLFTPGTLGTVDLALTGGRWSYQVFLDEDCDGTIAPDEQSDVLAGGFTVGDAWPRDADGALAGCAVELIVSVPAGEAGGRLDLAVLTAALAWQNNTGVADEVAVSDATTIAGGAVSAGKRVRNVTEGTAFATVGQGGPGDVLEYCIAFQNLGTAAVTQAQLSDPVPYFSAFVVGSAGADATYSDDDGATYAYTPVADGDGLDGAVDVVRWPLGTVTPGAGGEVCYQVVIR